MIDSILSTHAYKTSSCKQRRQNIAVGKRFGKDSYFKMAKLCEG